MKIGDIKNTKIAKKYSNALIQAAIDENKAEKVYNDILFVSETVNTNKNLADFLLNPVIKPDDKKDVINKLFSIHIEHITLDFLLLLVESGRLNALNEIVNRYADTFNRLNNILKPVIISAVGLSDEQKLKITEKLQNKLMKKIVPEYIINTEIIGGLVIEINDKTIDCSIKSKFENMNKQLTKGNRYGND